MVTRVIVVFVPTNMLNVKQYYYYVPTYYMYSITSVDMASDGWKKQTTYLLEEVNTRVLGLRVVVRSAGGQMCRSTRHPPFDVFMISVECNIFLRTYHLTHRYNLFIHWTAGKGPERIKSCATSTRVVNRNHAFGVVTRIS